MNEIGVEGTREVRVWRGFYTFTPGPGTVVVGRNNSRHLVCRAENAAARRGGGGGGPGDIKLSPVFR